MGYSRHVLVEVREVLLCGVQVQHRAGMAAQLPIPGGAAGLPGGKRGECVLEQDKTSEEGDRHHGKECICRSGSPRRMPGIILTLTPITQCVGVWAAQEALPQPSCWGAALVLEAALGVPGAGGSRGTPAAAGGGGGRCSLAVSGCSWWLSGKRQGRDNHHLPGHTGTLSQWGHRTQKVGLESQGLQVYQEEGPGAGTELRGGCSTCSTSAPGVGVCDPQTSLKGQAAVPSCQGNGKRPLFHIPSHLLVSQ